MKVILYYLIIKASCALSEIRSVNYVEKNLIGSKRNYKNY